MAENIFHISVQSQYLPQHSNPDQRSWRFAYTIRITNRGNQAAQLIARHWIIEDANHHSQEVRGLGVVGEQPLLQPGQTHEYTSGCELNTASGSMRGHYLCVTDEGESFECPIEPFSLSEQDAASAFPSGPRVLH